MVSVYMNGIQLIVGLGNIGAQYEHTRHNAGFWFVDLLAAQNNVIFKLEAKFFGDVAKLSGQDIILLKPNTYMNASGRAVKAIASFYKIPPANILVAHDELDLPVGSAKLKIGGGHGGHNGLRRRHLTERRRFFVQGIVNRRDAALRSTILRTE